MMTDIDSMITTYNTPVTCTASEILKKKLRRKNPGATRDVLDFCDEKTDLKKRYMKKVKRKNTEKANKKVH